MTSDLRGKAAVVTGASSGMGKRTAELLAEAGCNLVLVARRREPLEATARACEAHGVRAVPVPADVTDEQAMHRAASECMSRFGRMDAWVNAAAVAAFAKVERTPLDVFRRILDVNVIGSATAAQAALPAMRESGAGVLVFVASILGKAGIPYLGAYNASKFAVVGLAETLRMEVDEEDIHVCTVLPPATDTPFYRHAANLTGRAVRPPPPVYDVDTLAQAIVDCIVAPKREVVVGVAPKLQDLMHTLAPKAYERAGAIYGEEGMFLEDRVPPTMGSVFEPMATGTTADDGWKQGREPTATAAAVRDAPDIGR